MAVSQNGWPVNPPRRARTVPGSKVRITVADGPAGDVLMYVASQIDKRVEDVDLRSTRGEFDDWGWADRPIRGGTATSNHASATAIDINATRHPLGVRGTFNRAQVAEIHRILAEVDHVVRWGGDYTGRVDEMHFEINAPYNRVAAVANRLGNGGGDPAPSPGRPTLKRGSRGEAVKLVQRYLGITADGIFGTQTEAAVRRYQSSQGLAVDGIVGRRTWARIESGLGDPGTGTGGSGSPTRPVLKRGSRGQPVRDLQAFLNRVYPAYSQLVVDGIFGPATERVVKEFQRRSGIAVDGIVGKHTWAKLGF
ncbi:peptidoglycan hydrolase-like protein with peptidoglycan-binding domain [Amycolatopsis cihanbeyliensis]|uniref:Peptidoglycan hydrolase-like protein with peptidoglycan-binding domain n=1 Tax=Amycolatopsis cihanbeyliensis TaxID=1128664 RepID=A0A542DNM0_AMYCI|nr:peptidoglycan-binding protein [Amycolatopsis cihanbeyliensis]TQJ04701.1 peptidoglycan hydrolase-like protein with peptidoglycan-binding domain [Amycolatopsis cihanbeyliensis]